MCRIINPASYGPLGLPTVFLADRQKGTVLFFQEYRPDNLHNLPLGNIRTTARPKRAMAVGQRLIHDKCPRPSPQNSWLALLRVAEEQTKLAPSRTRRSLANICLFPSAEQRPHDGPAAARRQPYGQDSKTGSARLKVRASRFPRKRQEIGTQSSWWR